MRYLFANHHRSAVILFIGVVGGLASLGIATRLGLINSFFDPHAVLTVRHGAELKLAPDKFYFQNYQDYIAEHYHDSKTLDCCKPTFGGKAHWFSVLVYAPPCAIVEAQYETMGLTLFAAYYFLDQDHGEWKVKDWSYAAQPKSNDWDRALLRNPFALIPNIAVEIISANDLYGDVDDKVKGYLNDGVRVVWVINPRRQDVTVYQTIGQFHILSGDAVLTGGDILPGFSLPLPEIFG